MQKLTSFTNAWYAHELLRELVLIYPVYAIMIGSAGISPFELSLLFFAWSTTGIVFEVPSGALADRMPRRRLLIGAQILKASCFLLWWLEPSFTGYLTGFILWGIGGSLRSGTAESLLHDQLVELGRGDLFERIYGRSLALGAASVTIAMAVGGWAARTSYDWPLALSVAAPLATAAMLLLFVAEPPRSADGARRETYLMTLAAGLQEVRHSSDLRRPFVFLCTAAVFYEAGEEYFGPLLAEIGFSLTAIGLISALTNLARAAGAVSAERLLGIRRDGFIRLYVVGGSLLAVAALARGWVTIIALTLFVGLVSAAKVLLQGELQRSIVGHARATITSAVGFGQEFTGLALFLAIGAVASRTSWALSFVFLAASLIVTSLALGLREKMRQER